MEVIYKIADNIISSLGFDTAENMAAIYQGKSGVCLHANDFDVPEPFQASLAGGDGALAAGILRQHLADDEYLVAPRAHRVGDDALCFAVAIHFRRVDQRDAEIDAMTQRRDFVGAPARALAHAPGAKTEDRNLCAGRQRRCWNVSTGHG